MDTIKDIFSKKEKKKSSEKGSSEAGPDVPIMEISETTTTERVGEVEPILVKSVDMNSMVDVQDVGNELRDGNIVILNISPLMEEDPAELKRGIDQLKGVADEVGGDVGRLSDSRIIATPKLVRIQFKGKEV